MKAVPVLCLLGMLAGCGGVSPPERFYTLEARGNTSAPVAAATYRVSIGPVNVPDLVNRPQMVFRVSPQRVVIAEQSRWAEPLDSAIGRVIAGNLARQVAGAAVVAANTDADIRVFIDIQSFESVPGREAAIELTWTLKQRDKMATSGRLAWHEPVVGNDHEAIVAAHELALAAISRGIADAIRNLPR